MGLRGTVDQLARLLDESGRRVRVDIDPSADRLDAATAGTLGRVVREASTNILRYAPAGASCRVLVTTAGAGVRLEVASELGAERRASDYSTGRGLAGLAERVQRAGGEFRAGRVGGEWVVTAQLPRGRTRGVPRTLRQVPETSSKLTANSANLSA